MTLTLSPVPGAPDALVHVYLEDTTYADAPARVLLHVTRPADSRDETLTILLDAPPISKSTICTVRIHVDLDHDNAISHGDYISTESYRLAENLTIRLHPVVDPARSRSTS